MKTLLTKLASVLLSLRQHYIKVNVNAKNQLKYEASVGLTLKLNFKKST